MEDNRRKGNFMTWVTFIEFWRKKGPGFIGSKGSGVIVDDHIFVAQAAGHQNPNRGIVLRGEGRFVSIGLNNIS